MKKILLTILIFGFVTSCGSVTEGFKLKKGSTGDEFLVEKKNPLVLPPEFSELPKPGSTNILNDNKENSFESKILSKDNLDQEDSSISGVNSTEDFILKNIKKNEIN
tara:strand:+ start:105 stop:425 length:321 start_codon:yes stop_codon:yes gene_type:complete